MVNSVAAPGRARIIFPFLERDATKGTQGGHYQANVLETTWYVSQVLPVLLMSVRVILWIVLGLSIERSTNSHETTPMHQSRMTSGRDCDAPKDFEHNLLKPVGANVRSANPAHQAKAATRRRFPN